MSKKSETHVSPTDLAELQSVYAAEEVTQNKLNRATIAHNTSQQDRSETVQAVRNRYKLRGTDEIDMHTGAIARKSSPA